MGTSEVFRRHVAVVLILDDQDHHGEGCGCGECNANGKSYGVGIYTADATDIDGLPDPDLLIERCYGPSEDAALATARARAEYLGHPVRA